MKKLSAIIILMLITVFAFAQAPQKFSYQAVIRNSDDALIINTQVGMKISILQTSTTGLAVYEETHLPVTNANGLISIEVGNGTRVTGNFDTIDWADGPYFIKTETDPSGGTNYSITGTSQLLSVPYALYAKSAESVTGAVNTHYIGELYGGGVIYYTDNTGLHGLICSMLDLSANEGWSNIISTSVGKTAQSSWNGLINSNAIVNQNGHTTSAAKLCLDYTNADYGTGVFTDWYLPANDQLIMLHNERYVINKTIGNAGIVSTAGLSENFYWSSTEDPTSGTNAWYYRIQYGGLATITKDRGFFVRAIREF
jgi:hypothetical protein